MNLVIDFNKEEAETYIRKKISFILNNNTHKEIHVSSLIEYCILSGLIGIVAAFIMFYFGFLGCKVVCPEVNFFPILVSVCVGAIIPVGCVDFYKNNLRLYKQAKTAYEKYKEHPDASIHELLEWYTSICLWTGCLSSEDPTSLHRRYCNCSLLSEVTILDISDAFEQPEPAIWSTNNKTCITITYTEASGDVGRVNVWVDETKENNSIEHDLLLWKEGNLTYIKKSGN